MNSNNDLMPNNWTPASLGDFEIAVNNFYNKKHANVLTLEAAQFGFDYRNAEIKAVEEERDEARKLARKLAGALNKILEQSTEIWESRISEEALADLPEWAKP